MHLKLNKQPINEKYLNLCINTLELKAVEGQTLAQTCIFVRPLWPESQAVGVRVSYLTSSHLIKQGIEHVSTHTLGLELERVFAFKSQSQSVIKIS